MPNKRCDQKTQKYTGRAPLRFTNRPGAAPARNFRPTGYGCLWWVTTADRTAAFFALGFGGQLIEVMPQRHLVIAISTYVDLRTGKAVVNADDVQRLANAIVTGSGGARQVRSGTYPGIKPDRRQVH
jgi:CubicO group peptidase (beta-lactamase class C family)